MRKALLFALLLALASPVRPAEPTVADLYLALPSLYPAAVIQQRAATDFAFLTLLRLMEGGRF